MIRTRRLGAVVTALIASFVVAVAGCGSPDGSAGTGGTSTGGGQNNQAAAKNPCDLISTSELATIVQAAYKLNAPPVVTQAEQVGELQGRKCVWTYPTGAGSTDISVAAWHGTQYYTPDVVSGFTAIEGIGDAAHVGPGMFMFRKGDDVFSVSVGALGGDTQQSMRPAIAKLIVTKL